MFVLQEAAAAKEKSQRDNNKSFFRNLKVKLNKGKWASISISRPSMVSSDTPVVRTLFYFIIRGLLSSGRLQGLSKICAREIGNNG